jgi:hypothetical protein
MFSSKKGARLPSRRQAACKLGDCGMRANYYNGCMRGRLTASLVALVILVTGVVPAVAGYRCIAMGVRMDAPSACCHHEDSAPALKAQCCEAVAAARVEPRQTPPSHETMIQAPTVVGWIVFPSFAPVASSVDLTTPARARGRPPGEQLHLLSTVLRV